jgi:hypothetical protein
MKASLKHHALTLFACSILVGLVLSNISRAVYAFFFLPDFHGSWRKAAATLIDLRGWWAYVTSPFGMTIHLLILALVIAVPAAVLYRARRLHEKDG